MGKMDEIPKLWRTKAHTIGRLKGLIGGFGHPHISPGEQTALKFALKAVKKADKKIWSGYER